MSWASPSGSISHGAMAAECIAKREVAIYKWKGLLQSSFQTKPVGLSELKWRQHFFDLVFYQVTLKNQQSRSTVT